MDKAYLERHWEETARKRQDMKLQKQTMSKQAAQQAINDFLDILRPNLFVAKFLCSSRTYGDEAVASSRLVNH
jgi:hypothetical protein